MEWGFRIWMLMFWVPSVASAAMMWTVLDSGMAARPLPHVAWYLSALLLQILSPAFSVAWIGALVAQSALAIYLTLRLKLAA